MTPIPYLFFNGTCREALTAYAAIFGTEVPEMLPASELPPEYPVPEDRKDWVLHASMEVGDGRIMASDNAMGTSDAMAGCAIQLSYPTAAAAREVFDKLAEGGTVTMAFAPTFWSAGFGTLTDRFGVRWMVGCDAPPA